MVVVMRPRHAETMTASMTVLCEQTKTTPLLAPLPGSVGGVPLIVIGQPSRFMM